MDLFDPKPDLVRLAGQPIPESFGTFKTRRAVAKNKLLPPCRPFQARGQCGMEISDFLPNIAEHADDLCLLRGCYGDSVTHPESVYLMNTGTILMGKPSLGAWTAYGLGTENQNMPAFVVMPDPAGWVKGGQIIGATDAVGLRAVEERAHAHDIHATILHLLGFDHPRLTYRHNGRADRVCHGLLSRER